MKVYISIDMEGIGGVNHPKPTRRDDLGYGSAVELMTGEANAAILGAFNGGATEVLVNDSHGAMYNLSQIGLDSKAVLLQGQKPWSMVEGAGPDCGFGVALFVGYHASAGSRKGTIAHTYSQRVVHVMLNERIVGESGLNAMVLAAWGVPVGLVTGDDVLASETADWLPWAETVVVKEAAGRHAAASVHPLVARDRVRAGAELAVRRAIKGELQTLTMARPYTIEVEYQNAVQADFAAIVPGAERIGDTSVRVASDDPLLAFRGFLAGVMLVSLVD